MRFMNYSRDRREVEKICEPKDEPEVIVLFGDGDFKGATVARAVKKRLREKKGKKHVPDVDEFRTTVLSNKDKVTLASFGPKQRKKSEEVDVHVSAQLNEGILHFVRWNRSSTMSRDDNGARNIRDKGIELNAGGLLSRGFRRTTTRQMLGEPIRYRCVSPPPSQSALS